jgi:hypothetical protein
MAERLALGIIPGAGWRAHEIQTAIVGGASPGCRAKDSWAADYLRPPGARRCGVPQWLTAHRRFQPCMLLPCAWEVSR